MANLHEKIIDIKRALSEVELKVEDLRLSMIKEELDTKKEMEMDKHFFDEWMKFYTEQGIDEEEAKMRTRRRYIAMKSNIY